MTGIRQFLRNGRRIFSRVVGKGWEDSPGKGYGPQMFRDALHKWRAVSTALRGMWILNTEHV